MAWTLRIEVPEGSIKPQSRARSSAAGHFYSVASKPLKQWRKTLADEIRLATIKHELPSLSGDPVRLWLHIVFKRPKSHYRANGTLRPNAPAHPGKSKGDGDNLYKCVADEIERCSVLACDGDVVDQRCTKRWAEPDEPEHAVIELDRWAKVIDHA